MDNPKVGSHVKFYVNRGTPSEESHIGTIIGKSATRGFLIKLDNDESENLYWDNGEQLEMIPEMTGGVAGYQMPLDTESIVRKLVRSKIEEMVKKKDGKYVLYAPNKGRKNKPKPVGTYATKDAAKKAEASRFPAARKKKKKHENIEIPSIDKLAENASKSLIESKIIAKIVAGGIRNALSESVFDRDVNESEWDGYIAKLGDHVMQSDSGLQRHNRAIGKASEALVLLSVKKLAKNLKNIASVKNLGLKKDGGEIFSNVSISTDAGDIAPIMIGVKDGRFIVSFGEGAKSMMSKIDPEKVRAVRGELAALQDEFGNDGSIRDAVSRRDRYLDKIESQIDGIVTSLTPLQINMLKMLLVKKYRKS